MFSRSEIADIIIHIVFISTFIAIFFFTYVSYIESRVVINQINYLVESSDSYINALPASVKQALRDSLTKVKIDMVKEDASVDKHNMGLLKLAVVVLVSLFVVGLGAAMYLAKHEFWSLIKENLIILIFVALTEFCFVTFIALRFMPIDPNRLKRKVISVVEEAVQESFIDIGGDIISGVRTKKILSEITDKISTSPFLKNSLQSIKEMISSY